MRRLFYILPVLWSACLMVGCGGRNRGDLAQSVDSLTDSLADTLELLSPPLPEIPVLNHRLDSVADALAYMAQSDSAQAYSEGIIGDIAAQHLAYADSLLHSRSPYFIIVDKQTMFVVVYDRYGRQQAAYRMACSAKFGTKHARRDNRTPEGYFTAEGIYKSADWLFTDDDGNTSPKRGQFGPRFIRLKTPVTAQVGIHGTCAPWSRGHRSSHGCIRIHNAHILELVQNYASKGMPIIVNPSDRDNRVNREEGYRVPQLRLGPFTDNPINEDIPGLKEYIHREDSIKHRTDSIEAVERRRLLERQRADSLAKAASDSLRAVTIDAEPGTNTISDADDRLNY